MVAGVAELLGPGRGSRPGWRGHGPDAGDPLEPARAQGEMRSPACRDHGSAGADGQPVGVRTNAPAGTGRSRRSAAHGRGLTVVTDQPEHVEQLTTVVGVGGVARHRHPRAVHLVVADAVDVGRGALRRDGRLVGRRPLGMGPGGPPSRA